MISWYGHLRNFVRIAKPAVSDYAGYAALFAAWNAAIYVAQVEDDRLSDVNSDRRYIEATRDILQKHGGLWFYDESFVISRQRE